MQSLNRRTFVAMSARGLAAASVAGASGLLTAGTASATGKKHPSRTAAEWMNDWINNKKKGNDDGARQPEGELYIGRFADPIYFLTKPIRWKPGPGQEQYAPVTVPTGFVTDFASIPRPFWSLLRPDGDYAYAAVIHDFLYWAQDRPRDIADRTFKFAMQDFRVGPVTANTIYGAVRVGGAGPWSDNTRLRAGGERRVLKIFPDDPVIRWDEWRKKPGVFDESNPW